MVSKPIGHVENVCFWYWKGKKGTVGKSFSWVILIRLDNCHTSRIVDQRLNLTFQFKLRSFLHRHLPAHSIPERYILFSLLQFAVDVRFLCHVVCKSFVGKSAIITYYHVINKVASLFLRLWKPKNTWYTVHSSHCNR